MVATQIFFMFTPIWGRNPILLIFFRWIETTNQITSRAHLACVFTIFLYVANSEHFLRAKAGCCTRGFCFVSAGFTSSGKPGVEAFWGVIAKKVVPLSNGNKGPWLF